MHLEVATDIREGDDIGELFGLGGGDFTRIFAKLGRDVGELELGVDFFFGFGGDGFAGFDVAQLVFVEGPAHVVRAAAKDDVVFLGAGEIEKGGADAFFGEHADVDLQACG